MFEDDEIIVGINIKENSNKKTSNKTNKKNKSQNVKKNSKVNKKVLHKRKVLKFFMLIVIIIIASIILLSSSLFDLKNIYVEGNEKISDEAIISLSGLNLYENIFKLNKNSVIDKIKENAYIENAEISRKLPSTIEISIKERKVNYMLEYANSYAYINNQGYILEITNEKLDLPILIGYDTDLSTTTPGNRMDIEDLKKMDTVIRIYETAKSNEIGNLITKINISDSKDYILILDTEGKTVHLGECADLNTRILYLKSILEKTKGKNGEIFLNMDLNTDDAYFRPSGN